MFLMTSHNKFVVLISLEPYCMILLSRVYWKYFLKTPSFHNHSRLNTIMMCIRLALILIFWTRVISRPLGCVGGVMVEAEPDVVSCGFGVVVIVTSLVQASAIKQFIRFKRSRTIMNLFAVAIWISRDKMLTLIFQNTVFNLLLSVEFGKIIKILWNEYRFMNSCHDSYYHM